MNIPCNDTERLPPLIIMPLNPGCLFFQVISDLFNIRSAKVRPFYLAEENRLLFLIEANDIDLIFLIPPSSDLVQIEIRENSFFENKISDKGFKPLTTVMIKRLFYPLCKLFYPLTPDPFGLNTHI